MFRLTPRGRFVAAIGRPATGACSGGWDGHPLLIWDLQAERIGFPVASVCLPGTQNLQIGPIAQRGPEQSWQLPVYATGPKGLQVNHFECLACGLVGTQGKVFERKPPLHLANRTKELAPLELDADVMRRRYGVEMRATRPTN